MGERNRNCNVTSEEVQKLKNDLDKNVTQMERVENDMQAHFIDLTDKIAEIKEWTSNSTSDRDGMPSLAPLPSPNDDKLDMIMKHITNLEKEVEGDKGRQGKPNNNTGKYIPSMLTSAIIGDAPGGRGGLLLNRAPQSADGGQGRVPETEGPAAAANGSSVEGMRPAPAGIGETATRTMWDNMSADPLQHTGWSGASASPQKFAIHTPGHNHGEEHQGKFPRDGVEIHFTRNKEKGLEQFDGKAIEFRPLRRRTFIYISEENEAYAKLMEWARVQTSAINENPYDFGGTEGIKFGIDVKEFSRKLYSCLCKRLGKTMEGRIDRAQGRCLELWRSLSDEFVNQAGQMLDAKMKPYQHLVRA